MRIDVAINQHIMVALCFLTPHPPLTRSPFSHRRRLFIRCFKLLIDKKFEFLAFIQVSNPKFNTFPSLLQWEKVSPLGDGWGVEKIIILRTMYAQTQMESFWFCFFKACKVWNGAPEKNTQKKLRPLQANAHNGLGRILHSATKRECYFAAKRGIPQSGAKYQNITTRNHYSTLRCYLSILWHIF